VWHVYDLQPLPSSRKTKLKLKMKTRKSKRLLIKSNWFEKFTNKNNLTAQLTDRFFKTAGIYIYNVGGKTQINYKFIPTSLFRGCPLIRGFVVYLCFSSHIVYLALLWCIEHCSTKIKFYTLYIYIYIYI